jgi:fucose 4-O-acetylase-like acetyltransferase
LPEVLFPLNLKSNQALFRDLFNSRYILSINRNQWIDYARGICIILVCYRHCFEGLRIAGLDTSSYPSLEVLNVCFFSFRMPLFFIVSGLFVSRSLQKKSLGNYLDSRFRIVFYPMLIWGSLQITLQLLLKDYVNAVREPIDYLNLLILPRKIEQFWYLNALFFVGAVYAILKVALKVKLWQQFLLGLFLYGISLYFKYNGIVAGFLNDVFFYYIFFSIGDWISDFLLQEKNESIITSPKWLIPSLVVFIGSQTFYTINHLQYKNETDIPYPIYALFIISSVSGAFFVIQTSAILKQLNMARWLRVIGYHSLYIYLVHLIVIAAVRVVLVKILDIQNIPVIIIIAMTMGIVLPMILYNISVRAGAWWLFSLKKPIDEIRNNNLIKAIR